jgi:hypothetical protein
MKHGDSPVTKESTETQAKDDTAIAARVLAELTTKKTSV